jgi:hypothetical protein
MKLIPRSIAACLAFASLGAGAQSTDPLVTSWFTTNSGRYARIYETSADQTSGTTKTTWSRGTVTQSSPAYSGVQEISYSASWVYIRTTGLGFHNMGPWYLDSNKSQLFPNLPGNTGTIWRFPRTPAAASTSTLTSLGAIGYFVDGVAMFDGQDGYYWNGTAEVSGQSGGLWNRDAYPEEGVSFDPGNAHQEQTGTYHYHANPLALRAQLNDNVSYNSTTKKWTENAGVATNHSPLLGWVRDGYPIYGPYGYSTATNAGSGIRRMTTGYALRNGQNGTVNLASTGRVTLPAWAARARSRSATLSSSEYGPGVTTTYSVGRYHEDYEYLGDVSRTQGVDFDLDEHNGRFCVTPEFPGGTYAYFMTISSSGTPVYPYNIGRVFYGNATGGSVTSIAEAVTTNFVGGASRALKLNNPAMGTSTVTLTWSAVEGGTYTVEAKSDLSATNWSSVTSGVTAQQNAGQTTDNSPGTMRFYRVTRTALASYDTKGSSSTNSTGGATGSGITNVTPNSGARGASVTITITLDSNANPAPPPQNAPINSVTVGSIAGTNLQHLSQTQVSATIAIPANSATGAQTVTVVFPGPPGNPTQTVTYSLTGGFTVN